MQNIQIYQYIHVHLYIKMKALHNDQGFDKINIHKKVQILFHTKTLPKIKRVPTCTYPSNVCINVSRQSMFHI